MKVGGVLTKSLFLAFCRQTSMENCMCTTTAYKIKCSSTREEPHSIRPNINFYIIPSSALTIHFQQKSHRGRNGENVNFMYQKSVVIFTDGSKFERLPDHCRIFQAVILYLQYNHTSSKLQRNPNNFCM